jgi:hypothetical protein
VATTDGLKLPIPELTDSADGPSAFSQVNNAVEDYLYDRILPTGVTRYPTHYWGAGTTFPTTGLKAGDSYYHTGLVCLMRYDGANWRQAERAEVANATARNAISNGFPTLLYQGFRVQQLDVAVTWAWTGTAWQAMTSVRGKMWRTSSFSGGLTNGTAYGVGMQVSRLVGGFSWGGGDNAAGALSYLTIPYDGVYDLEFQTYLSGGAACVGGAVVNRHRAGAATVDLNIASGMLYKASGAVDHQEPFRVDMVPFLAGDQVSLQTLTYTNSGATISFYGVNEANGCHLSVTYAGPLNGAIPS